MLKLHTPRPYRKAMRIGEHLIIQDKAGQLLVGSMAEPDSPHQTVKGEPVYSLQSDIGGFWVVELGDPDALIRLFRCSLASSALCHIFPVRRGHPDPVW